MSSEELMKPRIKMIAPIPKVFSCGIEVGQIWYEQDGFYNLTGAHRIGVEEIKRYPHLFKELYWWEERKPNDVPEYVKWHSDSWDEDVSPTIMKVHGVNYPFIIVGEPAQSIVLHLQNFLPATIAEYEAYTQTSTTTK